jgi:hypothetical protein
MITILTASAAFRLKSTFHFLTRKFGVIKRKHNFSFVFWAVFLVLIFAYQNHRMDSVNPLHQWEITRTVLLPVTRNVFCSELRP